MDQTPDSRPALDPQVESQLRNLRGALASVADAFDQLADKHEEVRKISRLASSSLDQILLELDTEMEWDDD